VKKVRVAIAGVLVSAERVVGTAEGVNDRLEEDEDTDG